MMIAARRLKWRGTGATIDVEIRVFLPRKETSGAWSCAYEIDWPDEKRVHAASGVDAVQALHIALQLIGSEIYVSDYHRSGHLTLENGVAGYGFPVPHTLRDLLVGDDAKFL